MDKKPEPSQDPKDVEITTLKDRVITLEMVVRGYEDRSVSWGQEHRIACLRGWLETLAGGKCLDTAQQHAKSALNSDYNISLRELAALPATGNAPDSKTPPA